jgi:hypothetical protein
VEYLKEHHKCWRNLNHETEYDYIWEGKLSIINNNEELENYLICTEEYPVIDFSKHTLLLASGIAQTGGGHVGDIVFLKNSGKLYTLKTTIYATGITCDAGYWCVAVLVPKITDEESRIELNVTCENTGNEQNTIVNSKNSWATLVYGWDFYHGPCCVSTQYVYFNGDSIFKEYTYKKVFSCDDNLHENIKYEGLMREQDRKTYIIPANSEKEYLLYDFSLEQGMTFEYWDFRGNGSISLYVEMVYFMEVNGFARKRIYLASIDYDQVDIWIEEIGSLSGILYPCCNLYTRGGRRELLCYFQNNELTYKHPDYSECYYDDPEDIK